jgi:hypothetical protein
MSVALGCAILLQDELQWRIDIILLSFIGGRNGVIHERLLQV